MLNFQALFECSPNAYMLLDRELRFVAANRAYLAAVSSSPGIIGRHIFDVFPHDPSDPSNANSASLKASFERVLKTGLPDSLAFLAYRVPTPTTAGVGLRERFWSASHTPILGARGEVEFILQHTVDVTEIYELQQRVANGSPSVVQAGLLRRAEHVQATNTSLDAELRQLRRFFEQAPGFFAFLRGKDHVFELANQAYYQLIGHREIIGRSVRVALPDFGDQGFFELLDRVRDTGEPFVGRGVTAFIQRTPGAARDEVLIDLIYQPVFDTNGVVIGIFVQGHDITEKRLADRRLAALSAAEQAARADAESAAIEQSFLADAIPDQVWAASPEGALTYVNRRTIDYFSKSAANIVGAGWQAFIHPDDLASCIALWVRSLADGTPYECEFRLIRASDQTWRWHIARALPMRNEHGMIIKWYGSNTDIEDRKRTERERSELLTALSATNRELAQFAYVASHDLRAPLRGIMNLAQWIEEDIGQGASEETKKHLAMMRQRVTRMDALIDGVLSYARAGKTKAEPSAIDVGVMLEEILELIAPKPDVRIEVAPGMPRLETEGVALQQVLMNLIGNAVKHARRDDAQVRIAYERRDEEGRALHRFSVSDNGPGIDPRFHDRIWVLFQVLQPRDEVEGSGIGLSIAKKLVEARNGRIGVESAIGKGATFWFTWPE